MTARQIHQGGSISGLLTGAAFGLALVLAAIAIRPSAPQQEPALVATTAVRAPATNQPVALSSPSASLPPAAAQEKRPTARPAPVRNAAAPLVQMPPTPFLIERPVWIERASDREASRCYPARIIERPRSGRILLSCLVNADGRLACEIEEGSQSREIYGEAALCIARHLRMAPTLADGRSTAGGCVRVPVTFQME